MKASFTWTAALLLTFAVGCSDPPPAAPPPVDNSQATKAADKPAAKTADPPAGANDDEPDDAEAERALAEAGKKAQPADEPTDSAAASQPDNRQRAEVGVGEKGRGYEGILFTPVSVYFAAREQITFNIQIPDAMNKFKAFNDRYPKSEKEFLDMLQEYGITLPDLPKGDKYMYDPKKGELFVEDAKQ